MGTQADQPLSFDEGVSYRIRVQGRVPAHWLDRLEGMDVSVAIAESGSPVTALVGEVADQAALVGIMNTLYDLHLPILSVESIPTASGAATGSAACETDPGTAED